MLFHPAKGAFPRLPFFVQHHSVCKIYLHPACHRPDAIQLYKVLSVSAPECAGQKSLYCFLSLSLACGWHECGDLHLNPSLPVIFPEKLFYTALVRQVPPAYTSCVLLPCFRNCRMQEMSST